MKLTSLSTAARVLSLMVLLSVTVSTAAEAKDCAKTSDKAALTLVAKQSAPTQTIVEIAAGNSTFSTLVKAVQAAGLAETLSGKGPFTVFAPTNEAFAALPAGTLDKLLKPENRDLLRKVLTYHVVSGDLMRRICDRGAWQRWKVVLSLSECGMAVSESISPRL